MMNCRGIFSTIVLFTGRENGVTGWDELSFDGISWWVMCSNQLSAAASSVDDACLLAWRSVVQRLL